jgi:hypothetical protein
MTQSEADGLVPDDTFRVRLAIVRTLMGWNYTEAQEATGIGAESWRLWEKGERRCSDVTAVAAAIAQVTPYSRTWLVMGGPLGKESDAAVRFRPPTRPRKAASTRRVKSTSNRGCVRWTRHQRSYPRLHRDALAA